MYSRKIQIAKKIVATIMLFGIGLHAISTDAFGESLVYCFESDGSINIEIKGDVAENISSIDDHHDQLSFEYLDAYNSHFDIHISDICVKDNRTNRFDQDVALDFLAFANNRLDSFLPSSVFDQTHSFTPSIAEYQIALSLKTVVLLN